MPADVSRTRSTQVGIVVLKGYGTCLDGIERGNGDMRIKELR